MTFKSTQSSWSGSTGGGVAGRGL